MNVANIAYSADSLVDSIGMNVHCEFFGASQGPYNDPNFDDQLVVELANSKIRHTRVGSAAPSGDSVSHKQEYYTRQKELVANGMDLQPVAPRDVANLDTDYAAVNGAYIAEEGANEPDLGGQSPGTIIANQTNLFNAVKNDPLLQSLPVIGPSLTITNPKHWLNSNPDLSSVSDIGNWHTYIHGKYPESPGWMYSYYANAQKLYPNRPIYATEYGYRSIQPGELSGDNVTPGVPDDIHATYLPRWVINNYLIGFKRSFIHQIADNHTSDPTDAQSGYGMIDYNGNVKPCWTALKNLIGIFNDPNSGFAPSPINFTVTGGDSTVKIITFQKSNGHWLLAIWVAQSGWDDVNYVYTPVSSQNIVFVFDRGYNMNEYLFNTDGTLSGFSNLTIGFPGQSGSFKLAATASPTLTVLELW